MFGYVVPYKPKLLNQDHALFRAFYCGLCKECGRLFGQLPRFTVNYDITFFTLFVHALNADAEDGMEAGAAPETAPEAEIEKEAAQEKSGKKRAKFKELTRCGITLKEEACVLNPVRKKVTASGELLKKMAALNILLCRHSAYDGVLDGSRKMKIALKALNKPYLKAKAALPEQDDIITERYAALRELEQGGEAGVDAAGHAFSEMLALLAKSVSPVFPDGAYDFFYNLGKFVYLADALDDIDSDAQTGNFNPLFKEFGGFKGRQEFYKENQAGLDFLFNISVNRMAESFNTLPLYECRSLLENVVYYGLREKYKEITASEKKLKPPKI